MIHGALLLRPCRSTAKTLDWKTQGLGFQSCSSGRCMIILQTPLLPKPRYLGEGWPGAVLAFSLAPLLLMRSQERVENTANPGPIFTASRGQSLCSFSPVGKVLLFHWVRDGESLGKHCNIWLISCKRLLGCAVWVLILGVLHELSNILERLHKHHSFIEIHSGITLCGV